MSRLNLDAALEAEEDRPESDVKVLAESTASVPGNGDQKVKANVTAQVFTPVPLSQAEMGRMVDFGKEKFSTYDRLVTDMVEQVQGITVKDEATLKQVSEIGLRAKKLGKEIDTRLKTFTTPAKTFVKSLGDFVKPFTDKCDRTEKLAKQKGGDYLVWKELERRKAEKALEDARKEQQKLIDKEAEEKGVETVKLQPAVLKKEEKTVVRTEQGSVHLTHKKKGRVVNESLLPEGYWVRTINQKKIDEDIANGLTIPGVEEYEATGTTYRT